MDRYDVINESLRLETETLKSEIHEISEEKNKLQLELSAARIQINYDKEVGRAQPVVLPINDQVDNAKSVQDQEADKFTDELLEKVEKLTEEKAFLSKALEEAQVARHEEEREQTKKGTECEECRDKSGQIASLESQVEKLHQ